MHRLHPGLLPTGTGQKYMHAMRAWQVPNDGWCDSLHKLCVGILLGHHRCNHH